MSQALEQVQEAIANLQTSLDLKQQAIADAILALKNQIANGATPEELQTVVDNLTAVQADVESTPTE